MFDNPWKMQKIVESILQTNKVSYVIWDKGLNTPGQINKFSLLRKKKPKMAFIVLYKPKFKKIFQDTLEQDGLEGLNAPLIVFRGESYYVLNPEIEEDEIREEIYDEIINCGELYNCENCKDIIRSQKMKCNSCGEAYLCTFCFVKLIMCNNEPSNCLRCQSFFIDLQTRGFLEEMMELYKDNPRDLFTLLQKKKKELPPGLKNLGQIVQSAMSEAKTRGEKLNITG